MEVVLGAVVPIYFQAFDCALDLPILARVRDAENNLLDTLELEAVGDLGMYFNGNFQMPNTEFITIQYVVYSDNTYTELSPSQGAGMQTVMLKVAS